MKKIHIFILAVLTVCLGCASGSLSIPYGYSTVDSQLDDGSGMYKIVYRLNEAPPNPYYSNFYNIYVDLSGSDSYTNYEQLNMVLKEKLLGNDTMLASYQISFYRKKDYGKYTPDGFVTVDDKQFKLDSYGGQKRLGGVTSTYSSIIYGVSPDLLKAMKKMKKMSFKLGDESKDLDPKSIVRARSFVTESMGYNYQNFGKKVSVKQD
ncbi:MAG TPA: hypothetical protein PKG60_11850 [Spirochaetota bacterium]|nr:hypothetical protein [Spirochaetota bacterium]